MKIKLVFLLLLVSFFTYAQNKFNVAEHEYYDFYNSVSNPSKQIHFALESEPYTFDLAATGEDAKLFDTIFEKKDKHLFSEQVDNARRFYWGPGMIYGSKVANKSDIIDLFRQGTDEGWERFEKLFGKQEYWVYSVPLFSEDKALCVVKYVDYCGPMCKSAFVYYYKKEEGKWKDIYHYRTLIVNQ